MPTVPKGFSGLAGARFGVSVTGAGSLAAKLGAFNILTTSKVYDAIKRAHLIVEADAKKLMTYGYYRPAVDTGRLRMSVTSGIVKYDGKYIEAKIGTNVYYGIYVHEGTIYMVKRPFQVDALRNNKEKIKMMFNKAVKMDIG
jgi:HK97 gp10 family phage protein